MLIKSCRDIAPVAKTKAPALAKAIADPSRTVSIDANIARQFGIGTGAAVKVTPHFILRGLDLGPLSDEETKAFNNAIKQATKSVMRDLKAANPVLGGTLDGYELVIAATDTYKAWTDPDGPWTVKTGASTAKAMSKAVGALKLVAPGLAESQFVGTATLILSIADQAFQLCAAIGPEPPRRPLTLPAAAFGG